MDDPRLIRFGSFVLNRARGCLEDATGAERFLRPKAYRLLEVLSERRGQLVSKDDLVRAVWPDVFVSDDSLAQCVSEIRRALGPADAGLLRTVPRRGYMIVAEDPGAANPGGGPVVTARGGTGPRLAAKEGTGPFLPAQEGTGPRPAALERTVPRPAAQEGTGPRAAARATGPAGLRGAAGTAGAVAALAAAAVLVAAVGLWRDGSAAPAPPPQTAADVAVAEAGALLQARDWRRRADNDRARALLEAAVAQDPGHAGAWAALGLTYWLEVQHLAWGGGRREMAQALEMVERAVALEASAPPLRLLAEMRLLAPFPEMRSPLDALASARAAVAVDAEDPDGHATLALALALNGHHDAAADAIARALHRNPAPPDWHGQVAGLVHFLDGRPARAAEAFGPLHGAGTFANARWWPGWLFAASLAQAGRIDEAQAVVRAAQGRRPEMSVAAVLLSFDGLGDAAAHAALRDGLRLAGLPD